MCYVDVSFDFLVRFFVYCVHVCVCVFVFVFVFVYVR